MGHQDWFRFANKSATPSVHPAVGRTQGQAFSRRQIWVPASAGRTEVLLGMANGSWSWFRNYREEAHVDLDRMDYT